MNLTSLRPFLKQGPEAPPVAPPESVPPSGWRVLTNSVVLSLKKNLFGAGNDSPLPPRFEAVEVPPTETIAIAAASAIGQQYDEILGDYRVWLENGRREREEATLSVFALLKETLLTLYSGGARAATSLTKLETSLKKAADSRNPLELKKQIGEMLQFVQKESEKETRENERALASLNQRYAAAKHAGPIACVKLPGRQDALEAARDFTPSENLWAVVGVIEQLDAIRSRYGDPAVAELLQEVAGIRDKILATQIKTFQWAPGAVIFLVQTYRDLAGFRQDLKSCLPSGFEFKLFLGLRLATLNVRLRWESFNPRDKAFTENADRFAAATPSQEN